MIFTRDKNLPLTETTYYILLVLNKPLHGYGAIQEIDRISNGDVKIAAGTMYGAIENLLKMHWIKEVPSQDKRRRVYKITENGKNILMLETKRLERLITVSNQFGY